MNLSETKYSSLNLVSKCVNSKSISWTQNLLSLFVFIISGSGKYLDTNRQTNTRPSNLCIANFYNRLMKTLSFPRAKDAKHYAIRTKEKNIYIWAPKWAYWLALQPCIRIPVGAPGFSTTLTLNSHPKLR